MHKKKNSQAFNRPRVRVKFKYAKTKNYTKRLYNFRSAYQLHLSLDVEFQIPKDDPVRLLRYVVEGMDLSALYRSYSHHEKNQVSPRQLLEILIYANMNCIRSSRKIEQVCKRDINFMFLLQGKHAPDHATIARFRSMHLCSCIKEAFAQMNYRLSALDEISLENIFIDGTKMENFANKYKFVWEKAVTKTKSVGKRWTRAE